MKERIELLKRLSLAFGPSGYEEEVKSIIKEEISPFVESLREDVLGNLIAFFPAYKQEEGTPTLMISAHMDEVGLMVTGIDENGFLRFDEVGGLNEKILPARHLTLFAKDKKKISAVIGVKPTHLQENDERSSVTEMSKLFIDIGAKDKKEAERLVSIGDYAVFDSDFVVFGENGTKVKCKALDDRMGCAILILLIKRLAKERTLRDFNIAFCFTTREETGLSGALVASNALKPDYAIVVETTAVADICGVKERDKVAKLGQGGAISLLDRSTVYNRDFVNFALRYKNEVPVQIKQYVSGGNDSSSIHKSGKGCRTLAISAPTRYLHSASCVSDLRDYSAIEELIYLMIRDFDLLKEDKE